MFITELLQAIALTPGLLTSSVVERTQWNILRSSGLQRIMDIEICCWLSGVQGSSSLLAKVAEFQVDSPLELSGNVTFRCHTGVHDTMACGDTWGALAVSVVWQCRSVTHCELDLSQGSSGLGPAALSLWHPSAMPARVGA